MSQSSMQSLWYTCMQGRKRSMSPMVNSTIQITHLHTSTYVILSQTFHNIIKTITIMNFAIQITHLHTQYTCMCIIRTFKGTRILMSDWEWNKKERKGSWLCGQRGTLACRRFKSEQWAVSRFFVLTHCWLPEVHSSFLSVCHPGNTLCCQHLETPCRAQYKSTIFLYFV
jgi:hypothetical protein